MKKELIDQKFKKLSDVNKIRFNLGRMIDLQKKTISMVIFSFISIVGYLFFLPFLVRYGGFNRIVGFAFLGSILLLSGFILLWISIFLDNKNRKVLEEFLNKKSKERKR